MSSAKQKRHKPTPHLEATGVWISRLQAENADSFLQLFSKENIEAQYKSKPITTVKMRFMDDRIEFKSSGIFSSKPPRHDLPYRQIERFLTIKDFPTVLNLGVLEHDNSMTREMIKMKSESEMNEACDLIQKARQNPLFRLVDHDSSTANTLSRLSQSSLGLDSPYLKNGYQETEEMQEHEDYNPSTLTRNESGSMRGPRNAYSMMDMNEAGVKEPSTPRQNQPSIMDYEKHQMTNRTPNSISTHDLTSSMPITEEISYRSGSHLQLKTWHPEDMGTLKEELTRHIDNKSAWSVDVKCIESHPTRGNQISEHGSIYMFIAHMHSNHQPGMSMCSSSAGSLNSLSEDPHSRHSANIAELRTSYDAN